MSCQQGQGTPQRLVNQQPHYDKKVVMDKRTQTLRPSQKKKKHVIKWL